MVCLSSLLQSTYCPVSTGNTTTLCVCVYIYAQNTYFCSNGVFLSVCVSLCTFQKQSLARKILPRNSLGNFQSESTRHLCTCTQSQGGLARAQETSCQITDSIITVGYTFGQGTVWYTLDSRFSDPVTEACLCHYSTQKIILQLAEEKREEKSQVTCKYCQQAAVKLGRLKAAVISNMILRQNIWVIFAESLKLDLHLHAHLH